MSEDNKADEGDKKGDTPRRRKMGVPAEALHASFGYSEVEVRLGRLIRAVYMRSRSMIETARRGVEFEWKPAALYDNGRRASAESASTPPVWSKVARWCVEKRIDPVGYLSYRFGKLGLGRIFEPTQLVDDDHLAGYLAYRRRQRPAIAAEVRQQREAFAVATSYRIVVLNWERQKAWAYVLTDPAVTMSPLFRFCIASSIGGVAFRRIANYYHDEAVVQFRQNPVAYAKSWAKILPPGFAKKSRRNYMKLVARGA